MILMNEYVSYSSEHTNSEMVKVTMTSTENPQGMTQV
jgi:hypothetical protein